MYISYIFIMIQHKNYT